jgi:hypothetical protein
MSQHEIESERIPLYALGCLPQAEADVVAAHIAECELCAAEFREYQAVSGLIAYSAEPLADEHEASLRRVKSRLMAQIAPVATPAVRPQASTNGTRLPMPTRPRWFELPMTLRFSFAMVIAMVCASSAWSIYLANTLHATRAALVAQNIHAQQTQDQLRSQIALLMEPNAKHYAMANGAIIADSGQVTMMLHHLPALPAGKVYQAWTLPQGSKTMHPGGTFVPDTNDNYMMSMPNGSAKVMAVAVSVEPVGGSKQPTSKPLFVQLLT